jgi:hypothetical protein
MNSNNSGIHEKREHFRHQREIHRSPNLFNRASLKWCGIAIFMKYLFQKRRCKSEKSNIFKTKAGVPEHVAVQ